MNESEFDKLNAEDQRSATEIGIALTIVATRIPGMSEDVVDAVVDEFARISKLSRNRLRYIMEEVGRALHERDWQFEVIKIGANLRTVFNSKDVGENGDGESMQESAPID